MLKKFRHLITYTFKSFLSELSLTFIPSSPLTQILIPVSPKLNLNARLLVFRDFELLVEVLVQISSDTTRDL